MRQPSHGNFLVCLLLGFFLQLTRAAARLAANTTAELKVTALGALVGCPMVSGMGFDAYIPSSLQAKFLVGCGNFNAECSPSACSTVASNCSNRWHFLDGSRLVLVIAQSGTADLNQVVASCQDSCPSMQVHGLWADNCGDAFSGTCSLDVSRYTISRKSSTTRCQFVGSCGISEAACITSSNTYGTCVVSNGTEATAELNATSLTTTIEDTFCGMTRGLPVGVDCGYAYVVMSGCQSECGSSCVNIQYLVDDFSSVCGLTAGLTLYMGCGTVYLLESDRDSLCGYDGGAYQVTFGNWTNSSDSSFGSTLASVTCTCSTSMGDTGNGSFYTCSDSSTSLLCSSSPARCRCLSPNNESSSFFFCDDPALSSSCSPGQVCSATQLFSHTAVSDVCKILPSTTNTSATTTQNGVASCGTVHGLPLNVDCGYAYVVMSECQQECGASSMSIQYLHHDLAVCASNRSVLLYIGCGNAYLQEDDRIAYCGYDEGAYEIFLDSWMTSPSIPTALASVTCSCGTSGTSSDYTCSDSTLIAGSCSSQSCNSSESSGFVDVICRCLSPNNTTMSFYFCDDHTYSSSCAAGQVCASSKHFSYSEVSSVCQVAAATTGAATTKVCREPAPSIDPLLCPFSPASSKRGLLDKAPSALLIALKQYPDSCGGLVVECDPSACDSSSSRCYSDMYIPGFDGKYRVLAGLDGFTFLDAFGNRFFSLASPVASDITTMIESCLQVCAGVYPHGSWDNGCGDSFSDFCNLKPRTVYEATTKRCSPYLNTTTTTTTTTTRSDVGSKISSSVQTVIANNLQGLLSKKTGTITVPTKVGTTTLAKVGSDTTNYNVIPASDTGGLAVAMPPLPFTAQGNKTAFVAITLFNDSGGNSSLPRVGSVMNDTTGAQVTLATPIVDIRVFVADASSGNTTEWSSSQLASRLLLQVSQKELAAYCASLNAANTWDTNGVAAASTDDVRDALRIAGTGLWCSTNHFGSFAALHWKLAEPSQEPQADMAMIGGAVGGAGVVFVLALCAFYYIVCIRTRRGQLKLKDASGKDHQMEFRIEDYSGITFRQSGRSSISSDPGGQEGADGKIRVIWEVDVETATAANFDFTESEAVFINQDLTEVSRLSSRQNSRQASRQSSGRSSRQELPMSKSPSIASMRSLVEVASEVMSRASREVLDIELAAFKVAQLAEQEAAREAAQQAAELEETRIEIEDLYVKEVFETGTALEYYSKKNQRWLPAVVHTSGRFDSADSLPTYEVLVSGRIIREHVELSLLRPSFRKGEAVSLWDDDYRQWIDATIHESYCSPTVGYRVLLDLLSTDTGIHSQAIAYVPATFLRARFPKGQQVEVYQGPFAGWVAALVEEPFVGSWSDREVKAGLRKKPDTPLVTPRDWGPISLKAESLSSLWVQLVVVLSTGKKVEVPSFLLRREAEARIEI